MKKIIWLVIVTLLIGVISVTSASLGKHLVLSFSDGDVTINKSVISGTNISCNDIIDGSDTDFCSDSTGGAVDWSKIQNFTGAGGFQGCEGEEVANGRYQNGTFNCTTVSGSGDITAVNTNGLYLTGGAASGDVNLLYNGTYGNETINVSIDVRVNVGFLQNLLNSIYATITFVNTRVDSINNHTQTGNCSGSGICNVVVYNNTEPVLNITLPADSTHRIYDNATCIILVGDTAELHIC